MTYSASTDSIPLTPAPTSDVQVCLDDRVRLLSALLTATTYPAQEYARRAHGTHRYARALQKHVQTWAGHTAVSIVQKLLDQGAPLDALFALAWALHPTTYQVAQPPRWMPSRFPEALRAFASEAGLNDWWAQPEHTSDWEESTGAVARLFKAVQMKALFEPFVGDIGTVIDQFVLMPNIGYPTDQEPAFKSGRDLVVVVPPRVAWGDNPPWPFDEDPAHVYRAAITGYGRILIGAYLRERPDLIAEVSKSPLTVGDGFKQLYPSWAEQFTMLLCAALTAIYLEDTMGAREANAYALVERKTRGLAELPAAISVLRHYRQDKARGKHQAFDEFLPHFPKLLKVANRIKAL